MGSQAQETKGGTFGRDKEDFEEIFNQEGSFSHDQEANKKIGSPEGLNDATGGNQMYLGAGIPEARPRGLFTQPQKRERSAGKPLQLLIDSVLKVQR